jgi:mRNA (2'-O-methyladenosine-N6-)-methyltransferase
MDPPWVLSSGNPTRGVATNYSTLNDNDILNLPFHLLQKDGFLFIWVINNKYKFALHLFETHGY